MWIELGGDLGERRPLARPRKLLRGRPTANRIVPTLAQICLPSSQLYGPLRRWILFLASSPRVLNEEERRGEETRGDSFKLDDGQQGKNSNDCVFAEKKKFLKNLVSRLRRRREERRTPLLTYNFFFDPTADRLLRNGVSFNFCPGRPPPRYSSLFQFELLLTLASLEIWRRPFGRASIASLI